MDVRDRVVVPIPNTFDVDVDDAGPHNLSVKRENIFNLKIDKLHINLDTKGLWYLSCLSIRNISYCLSKQTLRLNQTHVIKTT